MKGITRKVVCSPKNLDNDFNSIHYLNSWVNKELNVCYQLMESNDIELFSEWFKRWDDFVDFELVPLD